MVEKESDFERVGTAVLVQDATAAELPDPTLSSAIKKLTERLRKVGVEYDSGLASTAPNHGMEFSATLFQADALVRLAIGAQLAKDGETNIGRYSNESILVPGNVVALFNPTVGAFLRLQEESVNFGDGNFNINKLSPKWDSERFLVVGAASSKHIALYSLSWNVFLRVNKDGIFCTSSSPALSPSDTPRADELFDVRHNKPSKGIFLFNAFTGKNGHVVSKSGIYSPFVVVQIKGLQVKK